MKDNITLKLAWKLVAIGAIILIYFLVKVIFDDFWIWGNTTDFSVTGQVGDFIGGVVGTMFALAGTLLIFLTFKAQTKQNKRESFESAFFQMINLHSQNVNQMNYTKSNGTELETANHRKVFRLIFNEFLECFREVKKFSNSKELEDYILPAEIIRLQKIITDNNSKISLLELALVDISYCIIFFGLGEEGEILLRGRFKNKYNSKYYYKLLRYLKLKPKRENKKRWRVWKFLMNLDFKKFKYVNEEFYFYRKHNNIKSLSLAGRLLVYKEEYPKYYGGHQHRLGHYFRHLFQSYKYLNYHEDLTDDEKYFYGKTLRAQLSTYEQALIFINSISSLGRKWEFTPEFELLKLNENKENCKLITRYNLMKNLPGRHFFGLYYRTFYPKVKYEFEET